MMEAAQKMMSKFSREDKERMAAMSKSVSPQARLKQRRLLEAVADLRAARDLDPSDATVASLLLEAEEEVRVRVRVRVRVK